MMTYHLEIKIHCHGTFQKGPEFSGIFFSMPKEALSSFLNSVELSRRM